jgi:hypothetical protein
MLTVHDAIDQLAGCYQVAHAALHQDPANATKEDEQ